MRSSDEWLEKIVAFYIASGDFNGFPWQTDESSEDVTAVAGLVEAGLVQVVSAADFENPHVRPWASRRTAEEQAADLHSSSGCCLYPTPLAMRGRPELESYAGQPYRRRLAEGAGQLDLAYFPVDVIEHYRNDPRYHFVFEDVEVRFGIGDEAYADESELERDKFATFRAGFAYDMETIDSEAVKRYACAFLRDLARLTSEHQVRWSTFEVGVSDTTHPHPVWWAMMMGQWPDGVGPFERIITERAAVSSLFEHLYGEPLFLEVERPREWGWVLRPTTTEWHHFVQLTDKLLSDSLRHAAFDAAGVPRLQGDGKEAGTLLRLRWFLEGPAGRTAKTVGIITDPLKRVRRTRNKPAHAVTVARTDATLTAQQRDLLSELRTALWALRAVLESLPGADDWSPPSGLEDTCYRL